MTAWLREQSSHPLWEAWPDGAAPSSLCVGPSMLALPHALFLPACGAAWQIEKAYDTIMMQQLFRRKQGLTFGAVKVRHLCQGAQRLGTPASRVHKG